jgi:hypothetical protein
MFPKLCARGVLAHSVRMTRNETLEYGVYTRMYDTDIPQTLGISWNDLEMIEQGFDFPDNDRSYSKNKYYKVGQNVARLVGLD